MPSRPDALRSTLDSLSLDPKVKEDRPYLVTVLRRLGYTEAEIEAHLGPEVPGPEPVLPAEPEIEAADEIQPRVVEVEYLGGDEDVQEYEPVYRSQAAQSTTFSIDEGDDEGEGLLEFEEQPAEQPLEFRRLAEESLSFVSVAEGPAEEPLEFVGATDEPAVQAQDVWVDDSEWPEGPEEDVQTTFEVSSGSNGSAKRVRVKVIKAASREEALEKARAMGLDAREAVPVAVEQSEGVSAWPEAEEAPAEDIEIPEWPEEPVAEEPVEEAPEWHEAREEVPDWPEEEANWDEGAWPEEPAAEAPAEDAWAEDGAEEGPADAPFEEAGETDLGEPFLYKGYTLHTREVQLSGDRTQRIYFFAKSVPKSGEPCSMPEGYKVKENERTGLPYLTRDRS